MSSKSRDYRGGQRRRGFDDDMFSPPPHESRGFGGGGSGAPRRDRPASPSFGRDVLPEGPAIDATVKWFNPEKGFGFAELSDGTGDAFLHIGALQAAGHETVSPGATLRVQVGQGQKGRQITAVISVDESTATEAPRRPGQRDAANGPRPRRVAPDLSTAVDAMGTVKWFNTEKGFGFVAVGDGGKDVFVHISVLERSGLANLAEGQQVSMKVVETPKGREAVSIAPSN
ncbi:MAG: cold shock domain-containing protein [Alphaproteobacteria bacterium]|nr:cold shock domain-containing protein [Alphaproteobacteria bacterium]